MKIVVDAFGGDNSPVSVIEGCNLAIKAYSDVEIFLSGSEEVLKEAAYKNCLDISKFKVYNADDIIEVEEDPAEICRSKALSSMAVGLKALRDGEVDAFVSAGSTGALVVGSSALIGRVGGIKRAVLAPILPSNIGCFMLLDAGANLKCRPEMFVQFGVMGSIYAKRVLGLKHPRVGLANVGVEASKGTEVHQQGYRMLQKCKYINFVGNVEARDVFLGACDVLVCDGLSGNMILKTAEGTCKLLVSVLKDMLVGSFESKLAAFLLKNQIKKLKNKLDYTEYGGAMLLGMSKPIIKAHGSSDANAFKNAIKQARMCVDQKIVDEISKNITESIGDE